MWVAVALEKQISEKKSIRKGYLLLKPGENATRRIPHTRWRNVTGVQTCALPISRRFFFFKQKTAYEMAQCDWSSDVCSSDLGSLRHLRRSPPRREHAVRGG